MIKGVNLTLLIGPAVPVPVPRAVLDALTSIEVKANSGDAQSGFDLTFTLDQGSPLHTLFLLSGGMAVPLMRIIVVVTINGTPNVLIDGMVTQQQVDGGSRSKKATLKVQGKDLSAAMTLMDFSGVAYPAMPPAARVLLVVAKYAWLGIVPMVVPSIIEEPPLPVERIPRHQGKDLDYVKQLARDVGYVFYVEPGPAPGSNIAYWGPEIRVGAPQPALNIDMDAHTNVESLTFRFDKEQKEMPIVFIQDQQTKAPVPIAIPDITPLNPPLGVIPPLPPKMTPLSDTAKLSPLQAVLRGVAYASQHSDSVFGEGSLDVLRYGRPLKSRQLVGVRGAGRAFDGLYYVKSVTHNIRRGEYKQNFTLARNGLVSTLPGLPA